MILTVRVLLHEGDFWNFPWWCDNSCPHFTVWLFPTFTNWIILWFGYIVCMLVYVSEDRFDKHSWGRPVRELARRIGTRFFVLFYPLTVLFFSTFGGISFQLPESVQLPYWLAVIALFGFYMIWTTEGMLGTKIIGKRGVLSQSVETFLEISREGMQALGDVLAHTWRRILAKLRQAGARQISAARTMRIFVTIIELVVISFAYFVAHLSGFNLLYAFTVPLYTILAISVAIGWFNRRKRKSEINLGTMKSENAVEPSLTHKDRWHHAKRHWRKILLTLLLLSSILSIYPFYPFSQCVGCQQDPAHLIPTIDLNFNFYSGNTTVVNTRNSTLFAITDFSVNLGKITGGLQLDGTNVPLFILFNYALQNYPFIGRVDLQLSTPESVYPTQPPYLPKFVNPISFWTNSTNSHGNSAGQVAWPLSIHDAFTSSDLWSTEIFIWINVQTSLQTWQFEVTTDTVTSVDGSQSSPSPPAFEHLGALGYGENVFYWTVNNEFGSFTVSLIRPIWVYLRPLYLSFLTVILGFYVGTYKYEKSKEAKRQHVSH